MEQVEIGGVRISSPQKRAESLLRSEVQTLRDEKASLEASVQTLMHRKLALENDVSQLEQKVDGLRSDGRERGKEPSMSKLQPQNSFSRQGSAVSMSKFESRWDENSTNLKYAKADTFHGGLEKFIGPPSRDVRAAMQREHVDGKQEPFDSTHVKQTTPAREWRYVTEEKIGAEKDIYGNPYERDKDLKQGKGRSKGWGLRHFLLHPESREASLIEEEVIALRLYTGPMYVKYNETLRNVLKYNETLRNVHEGSSGGSSEKPQFVTTIHAANSAIIKLSRQTQPCKVYRGLEGVLPIHFRCSPSSETSEHDGEPQGQGGIDVAFFSTSKKRDIADGFALDAKGGNRIIFEIQMGLVDRGASVNFLTQFPEEEEILFPPLTCLEVVAQPREEKVTKDGKQVRVDYYQLRLTCNQQDETLTKVVGKMKKSHELVVESMMSSLEACEAPRLALQPLQEEMEKTVSRDYKWFNIADNYKKAMNDAIEAREQAFNKLAEMATWDGEDTFQRTKSKSAIFGDSENRKERETGPDLANWKLVSRAVVHRRKNSLLSIYRASAPHIQMARMRSLAELCASEGRHKLAAKLLCLVQEREQLAQEREQLASPSGVSPRAVEGEDRLSKEQVHRLRAAHLLFESHQAKAPWPSTIQELTQDPATDALSERIAMHAAEKLPADDRFREGAHVRVWVPEESEKGNKKERGRWREGKVVRKRTNMQKKLVEYDVRLRDGTLKEHVAEKHVLLPNEDGPGALLRAAAAAGNVKLVKKLLEENVSCFEVDAIGNTALHKAARAGHAEICKLLKTGADENGKNFMHETPNDLAKQGSSVSVLRVFKPSKSDEDMQLYHTAEHTFSRAFCEKASAHDAEHEAGEKGLDPLETIRAMLGFSASEQVFGEHMKKSMPSKEDLLLGLQLCKPERKAAHNNKDAESQTANSSQRPAQGWVTPLMLACRAGHERMVKLLLEENADPRIQSPNGCTALTMAAEAGHKATTELLCGDLLQAHDVEMMRDALWHAAWNGHDQCVSSLLERLDNFKEPDSQDDYLNPALVRAAEHGFSRACELLIKSKADVEFERKEQSDSDPKRTALQAACEHGHNGCVKLLLDNKAAVDGGKAHETTPLMYAARHSHREICIEMLLRQEADVNKTQADGGSALMYALINGHEETANRLLRAKANPWAVQDSDRNLLMATVQHAKEVCCCLLLAELQKKPTQFRQDYLCHRRETYKGEKGGKAWTVLHDAARSGHPGCMLLLLQEIKNPIGVHSTSISDDLSSRLLNSRTHDGETPLMLACTHGFSSCAKMLLEYHAEVTPEDLQTLKADKFKHLMDDDLKGSLGIA